MLRLAQTAEVSRRLLPTAPILLTTALFAGVASANEGDEEPWLGHDPVTDKLAELGSEIRIFHEHITFLASPFLEGRLPGTRGMEIARDYCQHYLELAGLEPAFPIEGSEELGFRQPFELRSRSELVGQELAIEGDPTVLEAGADYQALSLGRGGDVTGEAVFVGYSIRRAPDGAEYESYPDGTDLSGKIAVLFRFEPMDEEGNSLWAEEGRGPWSTRAGLAGKVRAAERLDAAGVIIINPPGANDPRIESLNGFSSGGGVGDFPVFHMTVGAGEKLALAADTTLMDMRRKADAAGVVEDMGVRLSLKSDIESVPQYAENVGGLLPGKGELADQIVVVGAHLDHLGMGSFGSRDRENAGKVLHPGADDNASGSAGVLMLADRLSKEYAAMPEGSNARTILFVLLDAEESGLNGANHYVQNPIRPLEQHTLMMNYDMIGRIENGRISVSGHDTGEGLADIVLPLYEESPLTVLQNQRGGGGSDHMAFERRGVPVLFGIIARDTFHDDYHTPRDTVDKINRIGAVQAIDLWNSILSAVAVHPEAIPFKQRQEEPEEAPAAQRPRGVRFGIMPAYEEDPDAIGVLIERVSPDGPAAQAGVQDGDRLIRWNGVKLSDMNDWMGKLGEHEAGDKVTIGVKRNGEEVTLEVTLAAAE